MYSKIDLYKRLKKIYTFDAPPIHMYKDEGNSTFSLA